MARPASAGCPLLATATSKLTWIHVDCGVDTGAWSRRNHCDFQLDPCGPVEVSPSRAAGAVVHDWRGQARRCEQRHGRGVGYFFPRSLSKSSRSHQQFRRTGRVPGGSAAGGSPPDRDCRPCRALHRRVCQRELLFDVWSARHRRTFAKSGRRPPGRSADGHDCVSCVAAKICSGPFGHRVKLPDQWCGSNDCGSYATGLLWRCLAFKSAGFLFAVGDRTGRQSCRLGQ